MRSLECECPLLLHAMEVAHVYDINPSDVRCSFAESCLGSTNPDDCKLIEKTFYQEPDVTHFEYKSQPAQPVIPTERFERRAEKYRSMNGK